MCTICQRISPFREGVQIISWAKLVTTCDLNADLSGGHLWQTMRLGVHMFCLGMGTSISQLCKTLSATVATGLQFINSYGDETKTGS